ncbi:hypothetical protein, partial [Cronobacter malonaticus]|uniref:hypothetical protein n=1 Tax=Cronobacter malonaticus TaxID=413503 RepID=UPI0022A84F0A
MKAIHRQAVSAIKGDFWQIDFGVAGGMMRTNSYLPHGFIHVYLYPASAAFALWPASVDPGDSGVKYAGTAVA